MYLFTFLQHIPLVLLAKPELVVERGHLVFGNATDRTYTLICASSPPVCSILAMLSYLRELRILFWMNQCFVSGNIWTNRFRFTHKLQESITITTPVTYSNSQAMAKEDVVIFKVKNLKVDKRTSNMTIHWYLYTGVFIYVDICGFLYINTWLKWGNY